MNVQSLENKFVNGYRQGNKVLCVSTMDDKGRVEPVTQNTYDLWDEWWQICNNSVELCLKCYDELDAFQGKLFHMCEDNHRVSVWRRHMDLCHRDNPWWHYMAECLFLDLSNYVGILLDSMHDVNMCIF